MGMLICGSRRLRSKLSYADYVLNARDQELWKKLGQVTGGSSVFAYIFAAHPMKESRRRALLKAADVKAARGIVSTHLMSAARAFHVPDRPIREYRRAKNTVKRLSKGDPESEQLINARLKLKGKEWQLAIMTCENAIRKQNDWRW